MVRYFASTLYICHGLLQARNSEKAMTALARWRRMKEQEERGPIARRPHDVRECRRLGEAERFRREVLGDISKKIASIQVSC